MALDTLYHAAERGGKMAGGSWGAWAEGKRRRVVGGMVQEEREGEREVLFFGEGVERGREMARVCSTTQSPALLL